MDNIFKLIFLFASAAAVLAFGVSIGIPLGRERCRSEFEKQAVFEQRAEWIVDSQGDVKFRFKEVKK